MTTCLTCALLTKGDPRTFAYWPSADVRQLCSSAAEFGGDSGTLKQAGTPVTQVRAFGTFARMFLVPVKSHELPKQVRVAPVW